MDSAEFRPQIPGDFWSFLELSGDLRRFLEVHHGLPCTPGDSNSTICAGPSPPGRTHCQVGSAKR